MPRKTNMETSAVHFSSQFRRVLIISCVAMTAVCHPASADTFTGQVQGLATPDSRPCVFFSIAGVTQADPVRPGSPWVVVRQSQNGFKELYALLLAAKHTGAPVTVTTNGTAVAECDGHVGLIHAYHAP
jgi:hypothetical protein